jgi:hypothetical protein
VAFVFALALAGAAPAHAGAVLPLDEALARAFPGARFEKRTLALSVEDVSAVEARAHAAASRAWSRRTWRWRGDTLAGAAWTDRRVIRTREAVLLLAVAPDTSLARVDVLAFFEPPEYQPVSRWLALFRGRGSRKPLTPQRPVPGVAGVTLSSRAVNESHAWRWRGTKCCSHRSSRRRSGHRKVASHEVSPKWGIPEQPPHASHARPGHRAAHGVLGEQRGALLRAHESRSLRAWPRTTAATRPGTWHRARPRACSR